MSTFGYRLIAPLLLLALASCQSTPAGPPTTGPGNQAAVDPMLRSALAELAKGNNDKVQLGWYATSFLRSVDPAIKQFAQEMHASQTELHKQLKAWADQHHVDLRVHYNPADPLDIARQAMEKQQGDALQGEANVDFQRDVLILMYTDYRWQESIVQTLIPRTTDPDLKAYLESSLRVHEAGLKTIRELLGRYKLQ